MVSERTICCCGASTWAKVIAWFQIVGNSIYLIISILGIFALVSLHSINQDVPNTYQVATNVATAAIVISMVFAVLGLIMGIILLKGTNQKRVGYLRAWLIYGIAAVVSSIVVIILNTYYGTDYGSDIASVVISGLLGFAINVFTLCIVYIHIKEINEGVFGQQR